MKKNSSSTSDRQKNISEELIVKKLYIDIYLSFRLKTQVK